VFTVSGDARGDVTGITETFGGLDVRERSKREKII
jgi:hypothetical protein